jgi:hypothetical protein
VTSRVWWLGLALAVVLVVSGSLLLAANERPCLAGHRETRHEPARVDVQLLALPDSNGNITPMPLTVHVPARDVSVFVCDEWGAP